MTEVKKDEIIDKEGSSGAAGLLGILTRAPGRGGIAEGRAATVMVDAVEEVLGGAAAMDIRLELATGGKTVGTAERDDKGTVTGTAGLVGREED